MSDALLAAGTVAIQLLLGVMGIYVALRPPERNDTRKHLFWIVAFLIVGGSGVWLTYTLAKHADVAGKEATQNIQGAEMAATNANVAATKGQRSGDCCTEGDGSCKV
jgi:predicted membrane channel-forming protein YqfA (hemolysin III family)